MKKLLLILFVLISLSGYSQSRINESKPYTYTTIIIPKKEEPKKEEKSIISDIRCSFESFIDEWVNIPYIYGGTSKKGIDCSALVQTMAKQVLGVNIPRTTITQIKTVKKVDKESIQMGDLIFFKSKASPSGYHVGFYLWDNKFMHAARKGVGVIISSLDGRKIYMIGRVKKINTQC